MDNPVMIYVDTTDYPVEKIPFPTVTVCQKDNDPNKVQMLAKILNHVKFPCFDDEQWVITFDFLYKLNKVASFKASFEIKPVWISQ